MGTPHRSLARRSKRSRRQFALELLEGRYVLNGQAVLVNDTFSLHENGPQVSLDVLANDTFGNEYIGDRLITSVSFGSEGGRIEIAADRRSILYMPPADYFGTETFVYAVDGTHTATVSVSVQSPLTFDHYFIPPDGVEHQLDVLANDPFWPGYTGERRISSVSVGSEGGIIAVAADGKSIRYTPPEGAFGKETFIYVVDELYPAQVTIEIPETLKADQFELVQHDPATVLNVLANDPFWAGYTGAKKITHVTASQISATIQIASDGKSLVYTPPQGSASTSNYHQYDSFRYVVDGAYEAQVTVILYRPVQDDGFEVDQNSTGFFFDVTANDYYRDVNNQYHDVVDRVTSVTQSQQGGTVEIAAGGHGILYTPAVDFTGSDTFTYTADGKHVARVHVYVTRPVRDDYFSQVIYQDTPGGVLNVLGNDFLGNGYAGARLITAVGPTENGGTVTIRGDGKAILYTPAPGYTGQDSFTYTVDGNLEASVRLYVTPLAQPDYVQFYPDAAQPYSLYVLGNDFFNRGYTGPAVITAVELVSGSGTVSIQNGSTLLFDPSAADSHTIRYTVDGKYESTVTVNVRNVVFADQFVVDQNSSAQQFQVLTNDFYLNYPPYSYPGPRIITGVTQSANGGTVTIATDGKTVYYAPPTDYHGTDTFTYTVDGFMTATVDVEVIRRVRDDQFRVDAADGPQALPVLVNDLFGANYSGPGHITGVTATSGGGSAVIGADGRSIVYTPAADFVGVDTFTYTVDGALKAEVKIVVDAPPSEQSPTFGSLEDYTQFLLDDALVRYQYLFGQPAWQFDLISGGPVFAGPPEADGRSHSETNVQVAGVDEGDIVEFDSDYVYMLTDSEVVIVDAWPADELSVESRVEIEGRTTAQFLHGDRLTVISELGGGYWYSPIDTLSGAPIADRIAPIWFEPQPSFTIVTVIDVSNRAAPTIVQTTSMEGKYVDSRGVGDYVYVLVSNPNAVAPAPEIIDEDNDPQTLNRYETKDEYIARVTANQGVFVEAALPNYTSYGPDGEMVRTGLLNAPEDIYKPLVPNSFNLISVVSFNIESDEPGLADTSAVYSTGASAIYASLDNFYVFDSDYTPEDGAVTRIVKFDWDPATGGVDFAATTAVAGRILNQFSADENGPYLRIATTTSNDNSGNWSGRDENLLFVLQEDDGVMEFVGSLQNLALNETMRSVRFLGDRAFVTTFRDVDPLFAIDLADPANPKSVGHITLPGFTSYMHLVGANHLLTVGRNTPVGHSGPTQVSLFDISNLAQPLRIAEYTFERFSTSEAELDHHAFGFYAEHGLLGMPVARTFIERVDLDGDGYRETRQSIQKYDLAVFSVDVAADRARRLVLETEIEHGTPVRRSGYIGDKLYSIANDSVKVVDVADLDTLIDELIVVEPNEDDDPPPPPVLPVDVRFAGAIGPATTDYPATRTDAALLAAVNRARLSLAEHLTSEAGAALLVTAEAAPDAPGGVYNIVFRAGDEYYLYRAGTEGGVELVDDEFEFSEAAAWHSADVSFAAPPTSLPGDYNDDGRVDLSDHSVWQKGFGDSSVTSFLPADGNRGGTVSAADYVLWRKNLGRVANNSTGNGTAGYVVWQNTYGSTSDLRGDLNNNQSVDAADFVMWRNSTITATAAHAAVAQVGGSESGALAFALAVETQESYALSSLVASNAAIEFPGVNSVMRRQANRADTALELAVDRFESDPLSLLTLSTSSNESGLRSESAEITRIRPASRFVAVDEAFESFTSLRPRRSSFAAKSI